MHVPVLAEEVLRYLNVRPDGIYVDATLGGGGHAARILETLRHGSGKLLAIDRDPAAVRDAEKRLGEYAGQWVAMEGNFAEIDSLHRAAWVGPADGCVADLGISFEQLADARRGFSFDRPGPLDMRMDPGLRRTAADLVNRLHEKALANLIFTLGEERHSRRIARAIAKARPIRTTTELAQVVTRAIPSRAGLHQLHPATRTFMALRLAVNNELENLELFLSKILSILAPGGRLVILSFHSLEDRRVKQAFHAWRQEGQAKWLTLKVCRPSETEIRSNPRARSAKLRAIEKTGT